MEAAAKARTSFVDGMVAEVSNSFRRFSRMFSSSKVDRDSKRDSAAAPAAAPEPAPAPPAGPTTLGVEAIGTGLGKFDCAKVGIQRDADGKVRLQFKYAFGTSEVLSEHIVGPGQASS